MCVVCSKESQEALNSWTHYDNQQDSFCETEGLSHRLSVYKLLYSCWCLCGVVVKTLDLRVVVSIPSHDTAWLFLRYVTIFLR